MTLAAFGGGVVLGALGLLVGFLILPEPESLFDE